MEQIKQAYVTVIKYKIRKLVVVVNQKTSNNCRVSAKTISNNENDNTYNSLIYNMMDYNNPCNNNNKNKIFK